MGNDGNSVIHMGQPTAANVSNATTVFRELYAVPDE
jgi:hypothetical protein